MSSRYDYGDQSSFECQNSPSDSIASELSMDDFLRRLFAACDTDNDGYLDR